MGAKLVVGGRRRRGDGERTRKAANAGVDVAAQNKRFTPVTLMTLKERRRRPVTCSGSSTIRVSRTRADWTVDLVNRRHNS